MTELREYKIGDIVVAYQHQMDELLIGTVVQIQEGLPMVKFQGVDSLIGLGTDEEDNPIVRVVDLDKLWKANQYMALAIETFIARMEENLSSDEIDSDSDPSYMTLLMRMKEEDVEHCVERMTDASGKEWWTTTD